MNQRIHCECCDRRKQQAPFPRLDAEAPPVPSGAPELGQDNDEVWGDLIGLSPSERADHRNAGVI